MSSVLTEVGHDQCWPHLDDDTSTLCLSVNHHVVLDFNCVLTHHVVLETLSVKKMFSTFALLLTAEASLRNCCGFQKRGAYHFCSFFHFSLLSFRSRN